MAMLHFQGVFRTVLSGLRRHMMRAVLSGLGIVIGAAAVIAMMEIGRGASDMIRETIASIGQTSYRSIRVTVRGHASDDSVFRYRRYLGVGCFSG